MKLYIMSFGHLHGEPPAGYTVFDARKLPNPFYRKDMHMLDGRDRKVQEWLLMHPSAIGMLQRAEWLVKMGHCTIAFGCLGGQHRSVALAEVFAERARKAGMEVFLNHRELDK